MLDRTFKHGEPERNYCFGYGFNEGALQDIHNRDKVSKCYKEITVLHEMHVSSTVNQTTFPTADHALQPSFADVIRNPVQTAIKDENCKHDVIIAKAEEEDQDEQLVHELCDKLNFQLKPVSMERVGSRSFCAHYDQEKKTYGNDIPNLCMRPRRSKEDQAMFKRLINDAHKLNTDARNNQQDMSFSV
ncbi:hypothetical protein CAPTEDRAFT_196731 [Capitella teleta]|uniref:Uncharacterized protein n=1 Tax=Capitella teleta TaxID=283909 RepID=R7UH07_CAPTE|nr:hypothetical protein CAPTEDRAFT_196731 [Capitella teleta]|eukprot:ELU02552.1 hypothetical protein CAPTEDRAFT_196731 [Capitella teleta]